MAVRPLHPRENPGVCPRATGASELEPDAALTGNRRGAAAAHRNGGSARGASARDGRYSFRRGRARRRVSTTQRRRLGLRRAVHREPPRRGSAPPESAGYIRIVPAGPDRFRAFPDAPRRELPRGLWRASPFAETRAALEPCRLGAIRRQASVRAFRRQVALSQAQPAAAARGGSGARRWVASRSAFST
jgi:hypothetical protein